MKILVILFVVWANGESESYAVNSRAACENLSQRLAPVVESVECGTFHKFSTARAIVPPKP